MRLLISVMQTRLLVYANPYGSFVTTSKNLRVTCGNTYYGLATIRVKYGLVSMNVRKVLKV